MNTRIRRHGARLATLATALVLAASACGGSSDGGLTLTHDGADTTTAKPAATAKPGTTAKPAASTSYPNDGRPTEGLEAVKEATVQIVAQGTFVDPEEGQFESAGAGSGFIIDPSGLAVTNNHVVVGAGLLQVFVPGEDGPRNAKVIGVSECSDLAVIDIERDDFTALEW